MNTRQGAVGKIGPGAMKTDGESDRSGFSRLELLVVVAVIAALGQLQVTALTKSGGKSRRAVCANNQKQLIRAWQLYSEDNNGVLVMNFHGGDAQGGAAAARNASAWALGWLDWTTRQDNTNTQYVIGDRYAKLARYFGYDTNTLHCPSDSFVSAPQITRGWRQRTRSYSMNIGIGDGNAEVGPWESIYKHIRKAGEFINPAPEQTWVFLEEHPDSMNDPAFFNPRATAWIDAPAEYHESGTTFAFADGHIELHRWSSSLLNFRVNNVRFTDVNSLAAKANDPDIHWMSYRAGRISTNSY